MGYFVDPTLIETKDSQDKLMKEEIFGPILTAFVYPDTEFRHYLQVASETASYALTGAM